MRRITKEPWFSPATKEDKGRPITWQGRVFEILFVIIIVILVLYWVYLVFYLNRGNDLISLIVVSSWIPYNIVFTLTSDNSFFRKYEDPNAPKISNTEIKRRLKEKRNRNNL